LLSVGVDRFGIEEPPCRAAIRPDTELRGGNAAPTPCTDGRRVYALFGSSELVALDFAGRLLWRKDFAPFVCDIAVGTSPILTLDAVLVLADGTKPALSRLIAFDPATGNVKWERQRPDANFNHTTPVRIEVKGRPQRQRRQQ
jgi:outer membrane protein assembly factor BamB